jgi:ankyrin repeat protein
MNGYEKGGRVADTFKEVSGAGGSFDLLRSLIATMCLKNSADLLEAIRNAGVDVNIADPNGRTLLMFAIYHAALCKDTTRPKMVEAIHWLLQNGANVNLADLGGMTAFSLAVTSRQKDFAMLLFKHGAAFPSQIH